MVASRASAFGFGFVLFLTAGACGGTWSNGEVAALPPADAKFAVPAPCSPTAAQEVVAEAGQRMELTVEKASSGPGDPWVFERGRRLADPILLYRVDVLPAPSHPESSLIRVYSLPLGKMFIETQETLAKPGELAMEIVAACAVKGGPR